MKAILLLCAGILLAVLSAFAWRSFRREDHFGEAFTGAPAASIPDLVATPGSFLGKTVSVRGVLKRQCPATGCWFILADPADPQAREIKVEMGDTTPHLPARLGKSARVEGQLIQFGDDYEFVGVAVTFAETDAP